MKTLTMQDLYALSKKLGKEELILDVRSAGEFASGHVPGARHIDHEQVGAHADELRRYKRVYVHCKMGGRAQMACMDLESRGLTNLVCVAEGGMLDWISAGFPIEK